MINKVLSVLIVVFGTMLGQAPGIALTGFALDKFIYTTILSSVLYMIIYYTIKKDHIWNMFK